jgi:hypothetical protein
MWLLKKSQRELSRSSQDVVEGLLQGYMHKEELHSGEMECLEDAAGQIASDIMGTGDDLVQAVKKFLLDQKHAKHGKLSIVSEGMKFLPSALDVGTKITNIVTLSEDLVKECMHGDVLTTFNVTLEHLKNVTYLGDRLLANGADIAESLASCVKEWDKEDYHDVGEEIGKALRKVLLSKASKKPILPEGKPAPDIIEEVAKGITEGFFARGGDIIIADQHDHEKDIKIDLKECIADNSGLFEEAFMGAWRLIAQISANKDQFGMLFTQPKTDHAENSLEKFDATKTWVSNNEWMTDMAMTLIQVPVALQRCGLGQDMKKMMDEAVESLKYAKVKFDLPHEKFSQKATKKLMVQAVQSWTKWRFEDFGEDVGKLLREMLLLIFPQKYVVDDRGILRRALLPPDAARTKRVRISGSGFPVVVGGAFFAIASMFLAMRSMLLCRRRNLRYKRGFLRCIPTECPPADTPWDLSERQQPVPPMSMAMMDPQAEALVP